MRIANKILTNKFTDNINKTMDMINKYNNQIATGKKVSKPSDAPNDISLILKYKRALANIGQYSKNIDAGTGFIRAGANALMSAVEQGRLAKQLAISAANDPTLFSSSSIDGVINDVKGIQEEIRMQANTQISGKYIFSGYSTKTVPYNTTSNAYRGDTFDILAKIADDKNVTTNITGDVAFRESSIVGTMVDLANPIEGVNKLHFDNNVAATAGKMTVAINSASNYTGNNTGSYRVVVNTANAAAADVAGTVLDLEFNDGTGYVVVDSVAAVGVGVASETITLTDSGMTFDVDLNLANATTTLTAAEVSHTFDVGGDVVFRVSDGTRVSADIRLDAGTTYSQVAITTLINTAITNGTIIASGQPGAPTVAFSFDVDGQPKFEINPPSSKGVMEFTDLSVGTNQSTDGRMYETFGITVGFKNIFGILDDLQTAVTNKDSVAAESIIGRLDNAESEMLKNEGIFGARERALLSSKQNLEKIKDERKTLLSDIEDADTAEAITNMSNQQSMYEAVLYYGAMIQRTSLLDFLR